MQRYTFFKEYFVPSKKILKLVRFFEKQTTFDFMLRKLNQYVALLSLLVFLFPLAVKQLHSHQHEPNQHYNSQSGFSAAQTTHHCFVCDYIPAVANEPNERVALNFRASCLTSFQPIFHAYHSFVKNHDKYSYSLRGPPFIF
jgi:hypothetical protein